MATPLSIMREGKRRASRESAARMLAARAETLRVVATGVCPLCDSPLRRNLALAGWWQCSQVGAVGFRADSNAPQCTWQGFTE